MVIAPNWAIPEYEYDNVIITLELLLFYDSVQMKYANPSKTWNMCHKQQCLPHFGHHVKQFALCRSSYFVSLILYRIMINSTRTKGVDVKRFCRGCTDVSEPLRGARAPPTAPLCSPLQQSEGPAFIIKACQPNAWRVSFLINRTGYVQTDTALWANKQKTNCTYLLMQSIYNEDHVFGS